VKSWFQSFLFNIYAATPGITSSSHDSRVARDAAVAAMCFAAMYTDTLLCAVAAGSVAHLHAAVGRVG
jgi:hypothetical protein